MMTKNRPLTKIGGNQSFGGTGNHVLGDEFSNTLSGSGSGFDRSANTADITANNRCYKTSADLNPFNYLYVCRFRHCVRRFNERDQTLCFD
jgi:hypothetical protein